MGGWLLGLLVLLAIVAFVYALFGLRRPGHPERAGRLRLLAVAAVAVLAGSAWFGWPGPFGGFGSERGTPDRPPAQLDQGNLWLDLAAKAVEPSNRRVQERVEPSPMIDAAQRPEVVTLILRANDAPGPDALRQSIRKDAWAIFRTLYEDPRLNWIAEIRIVATHPSGEALPGEPGEPPVAELRLTRERFNRLNPPGVRPERLDDVADIWWLPPLAE